MIRRILRKFQKAQRSTKPAYIEYCNRPVDEKLVLIEGGQGSNINGNMFSMLKEIKTNPRWRDYKTVFVVTRGTMDKAVSRMASYGFSDVCLSVRNSPDYCKYLATAKYLLTDNSFPPYFNKRAEQVFLNTWHGTPLKTLGKSDKSNLASLANIQKNYLMSDYALFPNEFTRGVFMNDYDLKSIFKGNSLIANYPRNYIFYNAEAGENMKRELGFTDKKLFAYMPTWRGTGRKADTSRQLQTTLDILKEFDEQLDDSSVLLVNLHFLLASKIDCSDFKHIGYFPPEYDTYEILNACDGLITDYSSVFFDFAITRKKVILFAYDKEDYLSSRGLYMNFDDLPFPIVEDVSDVVCEMGKEPEVSESFLDEYCTNGSVSSCENLFELMVTGKTEHYELQKNEDAGKNICLLYSGALPKVHFEDITEYIKNNPGYKYVIAYRRNLTKVKKEFMLSLDTSVATYGIVSAFQFRFKELFLIMLYRFFGKVEDSASAKEFYAREAGRLFYSFKPEAVIDFSCTNTLMAGVLSRLSGIKKYVVHGNFYAIRKKVKSRIEYSVKYETAHGFEKIDLFETENKRFLDADTDGVAHTSYRRNSPMKNILPLYFKAGRKMRCISLFSFKTPEKTRLSDTWMCVAGNTYHPKFLAQKNKLSNCHFGIYSFAIPLDDVIELPSTNRVSLCYNNSLGSLVECHIFYEALLRKLFLGLRGPMTIDKNTQTVAIFRQTQKNRLIIYVRSVNVTDKLSERFKQVIAYGVSILWNSQRAKKLVILYEKNASKYEESASVLFENLIDSGYDSAYFIVTRDYEYIDRIPEKYMKNIIYKYSFKHYLYFFKSKTFIGTEAIVHAIDLKTFNLLALRKVVSKDLNYVFLQHGVMYMVSLNSESRGMFVRKKLRGKYRVVVSSQAEADHFTQLGRHRPSDLYITGLPKFDRNTHSVNADKIVIMPTWRPWEINTARQEFTDTAYFKMIMRIYNCVPEQLKEKVVILPHPLIVNELSKMSESISGKILLDARYDDILKETSLLITDYSSIAYDAFYRGANVLFYWQEKDMCMQQYGPSTVLMLNEENVFGDYFYSTEGLSQAISDNYYNPQKEEYIEKYSQIVSFHDGQNTKRLIELLKEDEII